MAWEWDGYKWVKTKWRILAVEGLVGLKLKSRAWSLDEEVLSFWRLSLAKPTPIDREIDHKRNVKNDFCCLFPIAFSHRETFWNIDGTFEARFS